MLATQSTPISPRSSRVLGRTDTPLTLLVRGGEHNGRTIRIASSKCTVGSARGCTFRLQAAGVRPVHCWILRGARATVLQAWTPDVQLNGAAVREAALRPGDRLRIGPIEFEVLTGSPAGEYECPIGPLPPASSALPPLPVTAQPRRRLEEKLQAAEAALQQREAQADEERRLAQAQVDQHRDASHLLRNECDQLQTQMTWEQAQWQTERAALDAQLALAAAALDEQTRQAADARKMAFDEARQLADSLLESSHELRQLRETSQAQRDELETRVQALTAQLQNREADLAAQCGLVATLQAQFATERGSLAELAAEWEGRCHLSGHTVDELQTRSAEEISRLRNEIIAMAAEGDSLHQRLAQLGEQLQARDAQLADRDAQLADRDAQLADRDAQLAAQSEQVGATQTQFAYEQESLAQQIANWEVRYEACEQELAQVRDEFAKAHAKSADQLKCLQDERTNLAAERDALHQQLETWETRSAAWQAEIDRLAAEKAALVSEKTSLAEQAAQWQARLTEIEELADQQSDLHIAELQTVRAATTAATTERNRLQAERATLLEEQTVLKGKCANLTRQIARLESDLAAERESSSSDTADQGSMTMLIPRLAAQPDVKPVAQPDEAELAREREAWDAQRKAWDSERAELQRQAAELWEHLAEHEALEPQLAAAQAAAQEKQAQLDALQQLLAAKEQAAESWHEQRTTLESELARRANDFEQLLAEGEQLREQLATIRSDSEQSREQLAQRGESLTAERAELAALRQSLTAEQEQLATLQRAASDEQAQFAERQTAAESDREAWESLLEDKEKGLERRAVVLAEQSDELSRREAILNRQLAEVDARLASLPVAHDELRAANDSCLPEAGEEPSAEVPEAYADEDCQPEARNNSEVDSILARLGEAGLLRSDAAEPAASEAEINESGESEIDGSVTADCEPEEVSPVDESLAEISANQAVPNHFSAGPAEDDDSIESYMSQLLRRVRGEETPIHAKAVLSSSSRPSEPRKADPAPIAPPSPVVEIEPVKPSEYLPRSQAPEQTVDVAAMRELANSAARMAISTHATRHQGKHTTGKLVVGALASAGASAALGFWALGSGSWVAICGTLASLAGLGYFAVQIGIVSCKFLRLARPGEKQGEKNGAKQGAE